MVNYSSFDYLCNEPFLIEGIGNVKCPTLRDIRKIKFNTFTLYINLISISLESYLKKSNALSDYQKLSKEQQSEYTLYNILAISSLELLQGLISFFIMGTVVFDDNTMSFSIYEEKDSEKLLVGSINNNNFETFREYLRNIVGAKDQKEKEEKFKNDYARQMYEKFQEKNNKEKTKKDVDENYELDNMILKFCTHNKTGINILNVWDMTYHQFLLMFREYCKAREYDYYDNMAANNFQFPKPTDYKPTDYMKKLK